MQRFSPSPLPAPEIDVKPPEWVPPVPPPAKEKPTLLPSLQKRLEARPTSQPAKLPELIQPAPFPMAPPTGPMLLPTTSWRQPNETRLMTSSGGFVTVEDESAPRVGLGMPMPDAPRPADSGVQQVEFRATTPPR